MPMPLSAIFNSTFSSDPFNSILISGSSFPYFKELSNKLNTTLTEKQNQKKNFAYGIIGIIILLSGYGFYRYRRFSRNKSEQKTLRDRLQISQDLHDNVGSTLSSISVFSKVAQVQGEQNNKEEMQEVLGRISDTSNEMVSEMNDIVCQLI